MNKPESDLSRQARLAEQREQRRAVLTTTIVGVTASLLIGGFAFARLQSDDTTKIVVGGASSSSFSVPKSTTTLFVDPTTTSTKAPATSTSTTLAPVTTTFPPIPANIGDLFTTTTAPSTTTVPVTVPPTVPTIAVAANVVWSSSPNPLRLESGAKGNFSVSATNVGNGAGSVNCPALPNGVVCTQQQFTLQPNQTKKWTGVVWATTTGTVSGNPLSLGSHQIVVGPAVLKLQIV